MNQVCRCVNRNLGVMVRLVALWPYYQFASSWPELVGWLRGVLLASTEASAQWLNSYKCNLLSVARGLGNACAPTGCLPLSSQYSTAGIVIVIVYLIVHPTPPSIASSPLLFPLMIAEGLKIIPFTKLPLLHETLSGFIIRSSLL